MLFLPLQLRISRDVDTDLKGDVSFDELYVPLSWVSGKEKPFLKLFGAPHSVEMTTSQCG
jgi:hypothetical protein